MDLLKTAAAMDGWTKAQAQAGNTIALVPTMGCFHEGHLSLMRHAARLADLVVVSLFVNPIQFGPQEDLASYPRDLERDLDLAGQEEVAVVFCPSVEDMYPSDSVTRVQVAELTDTLCGKKRPGHFHGVTTVVAKLFNIIRPQVAVFGRKDLQQLAVIQRMTRDLNWDIEIVGHPIVRESDGLAMSSRNVYLSTDERRSALALSRGLLFARQRAAAGETNAAVLVDALRDKLAGDSALRVDYVEIVSQYDLSPTPSLHSESVMALAVFVGATRLIDNILLLGEE